MVKYEKVSDETLSLFNNVLISSGLDTVISVRMVVDNTQKTVVKLTKVTPMYKFITGKDLIIAVNEEILDDVPVIQQNMCIQESLEGVSYDFEKESLAIKSKDFNTFRSFLGKYSINELIVMEESIKTLYNVKKERDAQNKQR